MKILEYLKVFVVNIILPIMVSWVTTKITYNREIQKRIYDEREESYIELFKQIELLKKNPYLVYNSTKFLIPFKELKSRLDLYASHGVLNILNPLSDKIHDISEKYFELYNSPEAYSIMSGRLEHGDVTELELEIEEELYMDAHIIEISYVESVLRELSIQIRKELKIDG